MEINNNESKIGFYLKSSPTSEFSNEYKLIENLGIGFTCEAYLAEDKEENLVVVKLLSNKSIRNIKKDDEKAKKIMKKRIKEFQNEINILQNLQNCQKEFQVEYSPYIIKLMDGGLGTLLSSDKLEIIKENVLYSILEQGTNGELYKINKCNPFPPRIARKLFLEICYGVKYLHDRNIAHLDLKTKNVLIDSDYKVKIIDFCFSQKLNRAQDKTRFDGGTLPYMAPEKIKLRNKKTKEAYEALKSDIFALGQIYFTLFSGKKAFEQASEEDPNYKLIYNNSFEAFWLISDNSTINVITDETEEKAEKYDQNFKDLFLKMISVDPEDRPNIDEIIRYMKYDDIAEDYEVRDEIEKRLIDYEENKEFIKDSDYRYTNDYKSSEKEGDINDDKGFFLISAVFIIILLMIFLFAIKKIFIK